MVVATLVEAAVAVIGGGLVVEVDVKNRMPAVTAPVDVVVDTPACLSCRPEEVLSSLRFCVVSRHGDKAPTARRRSFAPCDSNRMSLGSLLGALRARATITATMARKATHNAMLIIR